MPVNRLTLVIGILLAQIVNLLIYRAAPVDSDVSAEILRTSWNGQMGWRWMSGAETVPAALFFILAWIVPESPRWLASRGRMEEAEKIWTKLGTPAEERISGAGATVGIPWKEFLEPSGLKVLGLGIFLAAFQQWCGLNVVFNCAEEIFRAAGYDVSGMMFNVVITGAVNFVFTIVAIFLVDRRGRRPLMLVGAVGLAWVYLLIGISYRFRLTRGRVLALVLIAIACYAMTLAPITRVVLSEIFPNRIRSTAMSLAVGSLWISCCGLTLTFKPLNASLGPAKTFWFYGVICLVGLAIIATCLRETKGQTLEKISNG